jgi:hypothetical protein
LESFKTADSEFEKIKDYRIDTVEIKKNIGPKFEFYIEYSVLPETDKYALVGNGTASDNGWIVCINRFVTVNKSNSTYTIESMGTSPSGKI